MLAHKHLGSVNLHGGIHGAGTKIQELIKAAKRVGIGIVGIQETLTRGVEKRVYEDSRGDTWTLHTGGISTGTRIHGTGFLVGPDFEVVSFTALSPRVSWIKVQHHPTDFRGTKVGSGVGCFVNGYSPTESGSKTDPEGLDSFYSDLATALRDARRSCNSQCVPVVGDFNIHIGDDLRDFCPEVIGKVLPRGPSSANSSSLVSFCVTEGLTMVQTFGHAAAANAEENWVTWRHPRLNYPHMKDFVLIPSNERTRVAFCRPDRLTKLPTDHKMVFCKVRSGERDKANLRKKYLSHKIAGEEETPSRGRGISMNAKVRKLDVSGATGPDVARNFQNHLRQVLSSQNHNADWKATEKAMKIAAVATLPQQRSPQTETWETAESRRDLDILRKKSAQLRHDIATTPSFDFRLAYKRELRMNKREIKKCAKRHMDKYRLRMANIAIRSGNAKKEKFALGQLAKGYDLSLVDTRPPKPKVAPLVFKNHFEQLFSKTSAKETLGLTEESVGPKKPARVELSGPPTLAEIEKSIAKLKRGTAPGSNGLRPELFKMGGLCLAQRLKRDFESLWPTPEELGPAPPQGVNELRAKIYQSWQDADVVTLYKGKGAQSDPGSYRGIFLLDVAGKILGSVIENRLKTIVESEVSDTQNGFRARRSTSHMIHVLRRTQEACREANLKTFAVFIDYKKAFDSPPRTALWECLDWAGCPPDLLAVIMAIHKDPRGKLCGTQEVFRVMRGVRQGCVLGPAVFILLLEFCLRKADLNDIGVWFECVDKRQLPLPPDLRGVRFKVARGEFADDIFLIATCPVALSRALDRLQEICGSIGLDISAAKTEWMYLNNPSKEELAACDLQRKTQPGVPCCQLITMLGVPIKHSPSFPYLGSILSEQGGVGEETRQRVLKATIVLYRHRNFWDSPLSMSRKIRHLKSHVWPTLEYAVECGNHTQADLERINVFLNCCRRRLLGIKRTANNWKRTRLDVLRKQCRLVAPLELIASRRLAFVARVLTRPSCALSRQMLFAKVVPGQTATAVISGRSRSTYLATLEKDAKFLYSGETAVDGNCLEYLMNLAVGFGGPPSVRKVLNALRPDTEKGGKLRLVVARDRNIQCPVKDCLAKFAERKELNRHLRAAHQGNKVPNFRVTPIDHASFPCDVAGCFRRFKAQGWLTNHKRKVHNVA